MCPPSVGVAALINYCLYGVELSADIALFDHQLASSAFAPGEHKPLQFRGLPTTSESCQLDEIVPLYTTHGREVTLCTDRTFGPSSTGQPWRMVVAGVVSFSWVGGESTLYYQLYDEGTVPLLAFWFVHIFLPLYLTLERHYDFIHCAAVEIDSKPVLFVAPSTGGKSTPGGLLPEARSPAVVG